MIDFLVNYWLIVAPTVFTGLYLLNLLKKFRDEKAARLAPAPIEIER
mgnify:CR=1 FL=1